MNKFGSTWVLDAVYQVSRSSALGSEEGDFWKFLPYMGLEVILVMWPRTIARFFIPTSHGGSIWNLDSNGHVFFEEKKFENVESEWPWTKVTEWPWPWIVINCYVLIYLTICTSFHLTGFNSFLEIYSLSIFPYKSKRDQIWPCCKIVTWAANSVVRGRIWPNFKLMQALMYVIVTCKYKKDPIKNSWENVMTPFSPL